MKMILPIIILLVVGGCTYHADEIQTCITHCEVNGGLKFIDPGGCYCENGAIFR